MKTIKTLALLLIVALMALSCGEDPVDPNAALNDTTPPTVTITEPADSATLNANFVIKAAAQDAQSGILQVKFYINGIMHGAAKPGIYGDAAVHTYTSDIVNIDNLDNGSYTLRAVAYNAKNMATTNEIAITVSKTGVYAPVVTITSPATETVSNDRAFTADASVVNSSIQSVAFYIDGSLINTDNGAPFASSTGIEMASYTNNQPVQLKAVATALNGLATTNTKTITILKPDPTDTTAPQLAITSPSDSDTVSGSIAIGASASDPESGVVSVSFSINGNPISTDNGAPFISATLDTTTLSNGLHTITAIAENGVGFTTTNSITVTVENGGGNSDLSLSLVDISDDYGTGFFGTQTVDTATPYIKWVNPVPVSGIQAYWLEVWDADEETIVWSVINVGSSLSQVTYGVAPSGADTLVDPAALSASTTYIIHLIAMDETATVVNKEITVIGNYVGIAHLFGATDTLNKSRSAVAFSGKGMSREEYYRMIGIRR